LTLACSTEWKTLSKWSFNGDGKSLSTTQVKQAFPPNQFHNQHRPRRRQRRLAGSRRHPPLPLRRLEPLQPNLPLGLSRRGRAPAISASLILHNEGSHILPDKTNEGRNESIPLNNRQWNHVVWEIAPLSRGKITGLDFAYGLPKMPRIPETKPFSTSIKWSYKPLCRTTSRDGMSPPAKSPSATPAMSPAPQKRPSRKHLPGHDFSLVDADTGKVVLTNQ
jgi:hypothetical protein